MENQRRDIPAVGKTDEEIWRAIRDLDPDQRRQPSNTVGIVVIAVACIVWYYLIFVGWK